jgi:8-amino-7-oxononanoate synthase
MSFGLSHDVRSQLLKRLTNRRDARGSAAAAPRVPVRLPLGDPQMREDLRRVREAGRILEIPSPFFRAYDGLAAAETSFQGRSLLNFASYNYLGLNGDPRVMAAAKAAIDQYGTSVSASRPVSGERPIHRALETALAELHGAEDCVTMVSGHATNVTVIGNLVGRDDAVVHDTLVHNSIIQGALLSGAQRLSFAHNDVRALERVLAAAQQRARRVLVVIEGHYSMDGDVPDLRAMIDVAQLHGAWLMVDEAHSIGVLGATGRGVAEYCGVDPTGVDLWMGTLSKSLCGCGGYIAGSRDLIEFLRCTAPGFFYSVGMSPPVAAAALAALHIMQDEPWRVAQLNANASLFLQEARAAGLETGNAVAGAIVPVMIGSSIKTGRVVDLLFRRGVTVQPVLHPAVPEGSARLRFFLSALHTGEQIRAAVAATAKAIEEAGRMKVNLLELAAKVGTGPDTARP